MTLHMGIDFSKYIPLRRVIQLGDWNKAQELFNGDEYALAAILNDKGHTALEVAIGNLENIPFLENLLNQINPESLLHQVDNEGLTALQYAVTVNNHVAVQKLVQKNPCLLFRFCNSLDSPILLAALYSDRNTSLYLVQKCKEHISLIKDQGDQNPFEGDDHCTILDLTVASGYFDAAYEMLKDYPKLAGETHFEFESIIKSLAENSDGYPGAKTYNFYEKFIYSLAKKTLVKFWDVLLHEQRLDSFNCLQCRISNTCTRKKWNTIYILPYICKEASKLGDRGNAYEDELILAAENNIPEVIEQITQVFPELIQILNNKRYSLLHLSVINRCESVYKFLEAELMHKINLRKIFIKYRNQNNILHLAGKLAPLEKLNMVTGAALQMQRELQWFQEVSKLLQPNERTLKNEENETPSMVFAKEHEDLRQKGEEWMKKTADSYTITAALIIAIVFAAAITVPGGNNGDTRKAIYKTKASFIIFIISDAVSLFTFTTSLLLFLSILTARYSYDDFLYKLPKRLILGLVMLFLSVTTMLIAFGSTLYIMSGLENQWILVPIAALTCLPIASFVALPLV